jgi:hypothetical protein
MENNTALIRKKGISILVFFPFGAGEDVRPSRSGRFVVDADGGLVFTAI